MNQINKLRFEIIIKWYRPLTSNQSTRPSKVWSLTKDQTLCSGSPSRCIYWRNKFVWTWIVGRTLSQTLSILVTSHILLRSGKWTLKNWWLQMATIWIFYLKRSGSAFVAEKKKWVRGRCKKYWAGSKSLKSLRSPEWTTTWSSTSQLRSGSDATFWSDSTQQGSRFKRRSITFRSINPSRSTISTCKVCSGIDPLSSNDFKSAESRWRRAM